MMVEPNSRRMVPGGALEGSVGPSTSRILSDRADAFINQRDAFFRAGLVPVSVCGISPGAWPDMKRTMLSNCDCRPGSGRGCRRAPSGRRRNFEVKFLFQNVLGLGADAVLELGAEEFADGAVKFHRLRGAHAEDFGADDVKAGAREEINDVAGAAGGELEIVRLDEHQRAFGHRRRADRR